MTASLVQMEIEEYIPDYMITVAVPSASKMLCANCGAEVHLPFGGVKDTGNGHREASHTVLDTFTEWKSVYIDYSGRLQRAQIDNR